MCFSFSNQENIMTATKCKFYKSKFNQRGWNLTPSGMFQVTLIRLFCIPCCKKLSCDNQGRKDIKDHCKKESHKANVGSSKKQSSMTSFLTSNDSNLDKQVLNAEVMVTNFLVQHSIALLTADHLTLLFKEAFPDSKATKKYTSLEQRQQSL